MFEKLFLKNVFTVRLLMSVCPQTHLTVIPYSSFFDPDPGSSCFGVSHYGGNVSEKAFREVVKTTILEQDPRNHSVDGGLYLHCPSSTSKDGVFIA